MQKIELLFELRRFKQFSQCGKSFPGSSAQGASQPLRVGQAANRATDAVAHPFEIPVGDGHVAANLGGKQAVEVITAPVGQRRQHQW